MHIHSVCSAPIPAILFVPCHTPEYFYNEIIPLYQQQIGNLLYSELEKYDFFDPYGIPPILTPGSTNTNQGSQVTQQIDITICKRIIFKRVHQNIERLYNSQVNKESKNPALPPQDIDNPPKKFADYNTWHKSLENTPLTPTERDNPPSKWSIEARRMWERRLSITPIDPTRDPVPEYGSEGRQAWRERNGLSEGDAYGHWWVEIYTTPDEYSIATLEASFGWWPNDQVGIISTLAGVDGSVNKGGVYDPHAFKDMAATHPHDPTINLNVAKIDWNCDEAFHPVFIGILDESSIIARIKAFSRVYDDTPRQWSYPAGPFDSRSNCQKFQEQMIDDLVDAFNMIPDKKEKIDTSKIIFEAPSGLPTPDNKYSATAQVVP